MRGVLAALVLVACGGGRGGTPPEKVYGEDGVHILRDAERIDAFRLNAMLQTPPDGRPLLGDFPIVEQIHVTDPALLARVRSTLLDGAVYDEPPTKCVFDPGVGLRFKHDGETLVILICYHCGEINSFILDAGKNRRNLSRADFTRGDAKLLGLARAIFPDDPAFR